MTSPFDIEWRVFRDPRSGSIAASRGGGAHAGLVDRPMQRQERRGVARHATASNPLPFLGLECAWLRFAVL